MRILAIRGKNLASLAGEFEVDFRTEPLKSAGLFAISGATGAGKSTLLDALCLALYHDTPRLRIASENSVLVPDVGEHTTSPQDPRTLLRRGCSDGYAEVDFEGVDGVAWRARWEVRRARGRVDGKLQNVTTRLSRCDDDSAIGRVNREVLAAIGERIGLTFDQFRRAVLLAQNDFAALLKANQNDRADLLEALTGTELFSSISMLAHQRHASEQKSLQDMQQRLNLQSPLNEELRLALEADIAQSRTHCDAHGTQVQTLEAEQQWHQLGETLQGEHSTAIARSESLQQAISADAQLGQQLQRWNSIEPLRPLHSAHQRTLADIRAAREALPTLDAAIASATQSRDTAKLDRDTVQQTQIALEARIDSDRPAITAARLADETIRASISQRSVLEHRRTALQQEAQALANRTQQQNAERDRQHLVVQRWSAWQSQHPQLVVCTEEWPELGHALRNVVQNRSRLAEAMLACSKAEPEAKHAEDDIADALARHTAQLVDGQSANDVLQRAQLVLDQLDPAAIDARRETSRERVRTLDQLETALATLTEMETRHQRVTTHLHSLGELLSAQIDTLAQADDALARAAQDERDARSAFQRSSLIADQHTQQLRDLLVDGEPCAVCGAQQHPHAGQSTPEINALLRQLETESAQATTAHRQAITTAEHARAHFQASQRELANSEEEAKATLSAVDAARSRALAMARPLLPDVDNAEEIRTRLADIRRGIDHEQTAVQQAGGAVTAARIACESARVHANTQQALQVASQNALDQAREQSKPFQESLSARRGEHDAILRTLAEALSQWRKWPLLAEVEPESAADQLDHWQAGDVLRQLGNRAEHALAGLDAGLKADQESADQLDQKLVAEQAQLASLETTLATTRAERQRLLAHEDVEQYVAELETEQKSSRDALEAARLALEHSTRAMDETHHQRANRAQWLLDAESQAEQQAGQLMQAVQERGDILGLEQPRLADLDALIAGLPENLHARQQAWQRREQELRDALSSTREVEQKLAQWRADAVSQREFVVLAAELLGARAERDLALQTLGALNDRLLQDDQRRSAAVEQLAELEARTQEASRWAELHALIGSADGAKFKRYAQQFTLEVLIEYANAHLKRLAPRYRLRRGNEALSLLVIDTDLGDETRSVHSLSGGETFLVSLALALGLASLSSQRVRVESLFIDEGFGSLDGDTLNMAMEALDRLQADGRRVGVISHVHDMAERIGVEIKVERVAPGRSRVSVCGQG